MTGRPFLKHCLEGRDHRQFFAGARGGQNQSQSFEINLLGDETIATFRVRAPAERHERKVFADARQAEVEHHVESFLEPGGYPETPLRASRAPLRPQHVLFIDF